MSGRNKVRAQKTQRVPGNSLLDALPRAQYQRLLAAGLERVTLKFGEVLKAPGVPILYVYFPIDCVISLLTTVGDDHVLEVALVGHEGMVGTPLVLGIYVSSRRALVQGAGTAMRMKSAAFRDELPLSKPLQQVLDRYKYALIGHIAQTAACIKFHSLHARLARYLLMTADRAKSTELRLTHAFLSRMLGTRRVSVTHAASALQKRKLIKYGWGKITILDRIRLRAASCECYRVIRRMYRRTRTRMADSRDYARRHLKRADRVIE